VAQLDPIWVNFSVSQNEAVRRDERTRSGLYVAPPEDRYEVEIVLGNGRVFPHTGELDFADPSYDERTGTFTVRAVVPNPDLLLRPGMFVTALLKGATRPGAIVVPQRAVQKSPEGHIVWLVNARARPSRRPVIAGDWIGDEWIIEQGLQGGETLIVEGFQRLGPGAPVKPVPLGAAADAQRRRPGRPARGSGLLHRPAGVRIGHLDRDPARGLRGHARHAGGAVPEIAPPTVTVTAAYPGATAEVIANTVAAPIEQLVNGVDGMIYMSSTSSSTGAMSLTVTFEPGTDPDIAQVNTQNRVSQALARLPEVVTRQGVNVEKKSSTFMMLVSFYSPDDSLDPVFLQNYVNLYVLDAVKRVPGANLSSVFPPPDVAMRVWLKPDRMAQLGITTGEVANAIRGQNQAFGVGQIGQAPAPAGHAAEFPDHQPGHARDGNAEFEDIIVRAADGSGETAIVRLRDVARAELGAQNYLVRSKVNGRTAAALVVFQQPGANAIETSARVRALLEELSAGFPDGLEYKVVMDTSLFTAASIEKVIHTFFEAVVLVVLVVFLFLQSLRATIIPTLAVPIAIIGAYIGIYALGFSTNMLTLFGMILAIGLVVDDAIIVVEAVEHKMATKGMSPREASKEAMQELTGALISIVLVLAAVFLPVAFLGGMTGTLYKQFAITIAIAMVFSGIVALTLSPALAALILKPGHAEKKGLFPLVRARLRARHRHYVAGVRWLIATRRSGSACSARRSPAVYGLFSILPSSFVPDEDQGYIFAATMLPDAASLERTVGVSDQATEILVAAPRDRRRGADRWLQPVRRPDAHERRCDVRGAEALRGTERRGRVLVRRGRRDAAPARRAQDGAGVPPEPAGDPRAGRHRRLRVLPAGPQRRRPGPARAGGRQFIAAANARPELARVSTTFSAAQQQLYLDVDRARAELLGIPVQDVYATLQAYFGSMYVSQFTQFGRIWQVIIQAEDVYRDAPADLDNIFLVSSTGETLPLSAVATTAMPPGPPVEPLQRLPRGQGHGQRRARLQLRPGAGAMEAVAAEVLPEGMPSPGPARPTRKRRRAGPRRSRSCSASSWCS
jgi:multidrug efflux pump subunit AcrB